MELREDYRNALLYSILLIFFYLIQNLRVLHVVSRIFRFILDSLNFPKSKITEAFDSRESLLPNPKRKKKKKKKKSNVGSGSDPVVRGGVSRDSVFSSHFSIDCDLLRRRRLLWSPRVRAPTTKNSPLFPNLPLPFSRFYFLTNLIFAYM